jgi:hypothetical protein
MAPGLEIEADFAPNLWAVRKGVFNGLFCANNQQPAAHNSGSLTLTLTEKGRFSGKLQIAGRMYPFSGAWATTGDSPNSQTATVTIARGLAGPLTLVLIVGLVEGEEVITGSVNDGHWNAPLRAERVGDFGGNAPFAGYYTYATVPSDSRNASNPLGSGPAMMTVRPNGNVNVVGTLGDGRPYTAGSMLGKSGDWPLNVPLNGSRGLLQGRVTVGRNSLASIPSDPFCPTATLLNQNFDSSDGGFVSPISFPGNAWYYDGIAKDWRVNGAPSSGTNLSHARLTSPVLTVTRGGVVQIQFQHRHNFEVAFDVGQLRVSVNGGPFQIVRASAYFRNAPSASVSARAFGDFQRHSGFSGTSTGYGIGQLITSAAVLGRFRAGDRLVLEFFAAWDGSIEEDAPNWVVSEVILIEGACYEVTGHEMKWFKPAVSRDVFYPGGFYDPVGLMGYQHKPVSTVAAALPFNDLVFVAPDGNSMGTLVLPLVVSNNTLRVRGDNPPGLRFTVTPTTGQYTFNYTNPFTAKISTGKGVLLQWPNTPLRGNGYHMDTNRTGGAYIFLD